MVSAAAFLNAINCWKCSVSVHFQALNRAENQTSDLKLQYATYLYINIWPAVRSLGQQARSSIKCRLSVCTVLICGFIRTTT